MTTCACCGSEIPDQFATEFCDACHDPIKLRAKVKRLTKQRDALLEYVQWEEANSGYLAVMGAKMGIKRRAVLDLCKEDV